MNFLVDAQLPEKLCNVFAELNFQAEHVANLPNGFESKDSEIISHAGTN